MGCAVRPFLRPCETCPLPVGRATPGNTECGRRVGESNDSRAVGPAATQVAGSGWWVAASGVPAPSPFVRASENVRRLGEALKPQTLRRRPRGRRWISGIAAGVRREDQGPASLRLRLRVLAA